MPTEGLHCRYTAATTAEEIVQHRDVVENISLKTLSQLYNKTCKIKVKTYKVQLAANYSVP